MAKGFDPGLFGISRVNTFINDGYQMICRRVDYYIDESTLDFSTISGTALYPQPTDFARDRALRQTDVEVELLGVELRLIDRSAPATGTPRYYALDGLKLHLYPTPDGVYPLELRYWKMPALLVADSDVPNLPADYHRLLWIYAAWQCYESEDDPSMGQYWQQRFNTELSMFTADQRFPSTDSPSQMADMWEGERGLSRGGWSIFGGGL